MTRKADEALKRTATPRQMHVVPAFYLEGFASPGTKGRPQLHVFDITSSTWRREAPRNAARQRDYYRVAAAGLDPFWVENDFLGRIEDAAAPVLRRLRARDFRVSPEDISLLAGFVALMYSRVDLIRRAMNRDADIYARTLLQRSIPDAAAWERAKADKLKKGLDVADITYEDVQDVIRGDRVRIEWTPNVYAGLMTHIWSELLHPFLAREWGLFIAGPRAGPFVTSDAPVSLHAQGDSRRFEVESIDPRSPETSVLVPLSPHALLISDPNVGTELREVSAADVGRCNAGTVMPGRRVVYAATSHFRWFDVRAGNLRGPAELGPVAREMDAELEATQAAQATRINSELAAEDAEGA